MSCEAVTVAAVAVFFLQTKIRTQLRSRVR